MGIEFDGDYKGYPGYQSQGGYGGGFGNEPKGITGWLIKKGIVKDESQSKLLQIVLVCINIAVTVFVVVKFL